MNPIRLLKANEIDCRVAQIARDGKSLSLLLYKDARVDMNILDETFGPMNWQRRHTRDNANCVVSIWDSDKRCWVEKEDTGTESNTEAEKGLASDSFKRACFNVGIGRELYTAPTIRVYSPNCEIKENKQRPGTFACYDRFVVQEIGYNDDREINRLVIVNEKTRNVVYEFGKAAPDGQKRPVQPPKATDDKSINPAQKTAQRGRQGATVPSSRQKATDEQKKWLVDNTTDEQYTTIMQKYGAELENMTANQAAEEIKAIEAAMKDMTVRCERCDGAITGVVLPDGTMMTGAEVIAKSKLTYGGCYCWNCAKELAKKRKAG